MMVLMNRKVSWGAILAMLVAAGSCGGSIREVRTNSGGILDCRSETVAYVFLDSSPEAGSAVPADALAVLAPDSVPPVPPGTPEVESASDLKVIYLYTDSEGRRVGRVVVEKPFGAGWSVTRTERCG
jgi:hypothetical protein